MVVTPLDLVAGKNRDYQFSFIVPLLMLLWQALWWSLSASWPTFRSDSVRDVQREVVNHEWRSSTAGVRRRWRLRGVTHFWVSFSCLMYLSSGINFLLCRAWTEHRIFQKLLAMVPNFLERVIESEAELVVIAESVRIYLSNIWPFWIHYRFRKEFLEQDLTTLKVWKVWSSTGSPREMVFYSRRSLEISRQTVGSITLLQVPFSAQPVLTGMIPGE